MAARLGAGGRGGRTSRSRAGYGGAQAVPGDSGGEGRDAALLHRRVECGWPLELGDLQGSATESEGYGEEDKGEQPVLGSFGNSAVAGGGDQCNYECKVIGSFGTAGADDGRKYEGMVSDNFGDLAGTVCVDVADHQYKGKQSDDFGISAGAEKRSASEDKKVWTSASPRAETGRERGQEGVRVGHGRGRSARPRLRRRQLRGGRRWRSVPLRVQGDRQLRHSGRGRRVHVRGPGHTQLRRLEGIADCVDVAGDYQYKGNQSYDFGISAGKAMRSECEDKKANESCEGEVEQRLFGSFGDNSAVDGEGDQCNVECKEIGSFGDTAGADDWGTYEGQVSDHFGGSAGIVDRVDESDHQYNGKQSEGDEHFVFGSLTYKGKKNEANQKVKADAYVGECGGNTDADTVVSGIAVPTSKQNAGRSSAANSQLQMHRLAMLRNMASVIIDGEARAPPATTSSEYSSAS